MSEFDTTNNLIASRYMSEFEKHAKSFSGVVTGINGKKIFVKSGDQERVFTAEGSVSSASLPGHEVTVVTWLNSSAIRVVNHTTDTIYRPFWNKNPDRKVNLKELPSSAISAKQSSIGFFTSIITSVFIGAVLSIPVFGWFAIANVIIDAGEDDTGKSPQFATKITLSYVLCVTLAFLAAFLTFIPTGSFKVPAILFLTFISLGNFFTIRYVNKALLEIEAFTQELVADQAKRLRNAA